MKTKSIILIPTVLISLVGCSRSNVGVQVSDILERLDKTEASLKESRHEIDSRRHQVDVLNKEVASLESDKRQLSNEVIQQRRINKQKSSSAEKTMNVTEKLETKATVAAIFHTTHSHGVSIPGETPQTTLRAKWDQEEETFWLSIHDERKDTIWHIDSEKQNGHPAINVELETAIHEWGVISLYYSESWESPYLHWQIGNGVPGMLSGEYLDVLICATQETLRFNTDQQAVKTALSNFFVPAVRAHERLAAAKKAEEEKKLIDQVCGKWRNKGSDLKVYCHILKDGSGDINVLGFVNLPKEGYPNGTFDWSVENDSIVTDSFSIRPVSDDSVKVSFLNKKKSNYGSGGLTLKRSSY